jgi:hypothetical protein
VGKQAAKGVVGRLSYLLQNNMHLKGLAICIPQPESLRNGIKTAVHQQQITDIANI